VPTHTKQLASGWKTSSGTATVLLYTCPAGKRTIIKRITAAGIVTGVDVSFYCTTTSGAVVNWIFTHNALTGTDDHETWCVLHPGDELSLAITVPSGGFASWLVSGTELFIG
jgi:hypothetical protein